MTVDLYEVLRDLMEAPAVTGFEEQRRERIVEKYSEYCDSVSVDVIGNVIGTLGDGERTVMLAGHYDQLGFMVTHVDEKGYASFERVGGWDPRVAYGARVRIWVGDEPDAYVTGVIGPKPAHLTEPSEREKAVKWKDMRIDFGAKDAEEAEGMGVRIGRPVTPDSPLARMGKGDGDLVMGPAFDDVCAVAAFIGALDELHGELPEGVKLHAVATVQEEIGLRGATVSGYNLKPWCAIAVDVTHAVAPGVEASRVGGIQLGKGPAIGIGANFTKPLWELMMREAEGKGIPYQREGYPSRSGTDAWALQILRGGTISGLISVPNRYMHSPNEVISLSDLENTGRLLVTTVRALGESDLRHTVEVFRKES
ncbi:MAG: M20/M25/M40 family metallo-hydrolase [Candidatus Bathyarchaeota archaeon]|nr:M20/M25/M40 family metallo-hydrolase [Candidatus Bathyarchaeota archaeon]